VREQITVPLAAPARKRDGLRQVALLIPALVGTGMPCQKASR
jgi:hypothetical protein